MFCIYVSFINYNLVLTLILILQLTQINTMYRMINYWIITLEVIIFLSYTWNFVKAYIDSENYYFKEISFLVITNDLTKNCLIYKPLLMHYIFNLQKNILYTNKYYEKYNSEIFNFFNYILYTFRNWKGILKVLFFITIVLKNIYCWVIIIILFSIVIGQYHFSFVVELTLLFLFTYQFCKFNLIEEKNNKETYKKNLDSSFNWMNLYLKISIVYFSLITIVVYLYQFLRYDIILNKSSMTNTKQFLAVNVLKLFGLSVFNQKVLFKNLVPHFLVIILSVMLKYEIESTLNLYKSDEEINFSLSYQKYLIDFVEEKATSTLSKNYDFEKENEKIAETFKINKIKFFFLRFFKFISQKYYLFILICITAVFIFNEFNIALFSIFMIFILNLMNQYMSILNYRSKVTNLKFNCK